MHGWGSNFMVAVVLIHMAQVFLFGAYKFPRELTWILGVFLLLMTLGMAFTGQVLRFDQDAYWGLGIGASIASRVPFIGSTAVHMMLGGPIIAGATLSRFFAFHVFVIPGMLLVFACLHVWMVVKLGINEWPMPGRVVRRATYLTEYHELTKKDGRAIRAGELFGRTPSFRRRSSRQSPFAQPSSDLTARRATGSYDHSDCAETGFLLPVALRCIVLSSSLPGDTISPDRPCARNRRTRSSSVLRG